MSYLHIQPGTPKLYDVVVFPVTQEEEITATIAEGWEKALQTTDRAWFRRPRWVPSRDLYGGIDRILIPVAAGQTNILTISQGDCGSLNVIKRSIDGEFSQ